jgi:site-specific DNA recombinase
MKTAVLYLRVSTTSQVQTDYDPEGISIPAQRLACQRKAEQMGAEVVGEYVEPGRSATTIEKRPIFQEMLARVKRDRDADYVIVYNLSRLNRNRVDDAKVLMLMRSLKVTLVSAQENIDETPAGQLMHGILAAFNEYRSNADGADIRYKMGQKARSGGTLTRAKIGYVNVRDVIDGHEIRTVAIDEERAPLIRLAFELCATGDYTMTRLAAVLAERGLRMRPQANRTAGAISAKYLPRVLRDRYYIGVVTYNGEEYTGRHEPLVSRELFARVQIVLDGRLAKTGERRRTHHHYLKSTVWCGRCHQRGVESQLILMRAVGHGGEYWYFFCTFRRDGACDAPYIRIEDAEAAVLRHYATLRLPADFAAKVRDVLEATLQDEGHSSRLLRDHFIKRLRDLDAKEDNLLDLAEGGGIAAAKVRSRLEAIADERAKTQAELAAEGPRLETGAATIRTALDLLDDPQELYRQTSNAVRRQLNQVFFGKLYLDADEITDDLLAEPFDGLLYRRSFRRPSPLLHQRSKPGHAKTGDLVGAGQRTGSATTLFERIARDEGSNKDTMVELRGFEPLTPSMRTRWGRHRALVVGQLRLRTHLLSNLAREPMANLDIAMRRTRPDRSAGTRADGVGDIS